MNAMTPLTRTLTALSHKEPDRVPLFLLLTLHGAPELGLPIQQYFSKGQYVAEGQLRLQRKFGHDCLYAFFYAAVELEAWGGEAIFRDDGPPNAGPPVVRRRQDILSLVPPPSRVLLRFTRSSTPFGCSRSKLGARSPSLAS